ncbi:hypothetical protein [Cribrihabitans marinus]|uniref:hypothetical protein n=1 Tax=Cribrihabitans marinus TaxID=1227549 RepID=UPI00115F9DED|nr:hypothetical protein [Cribrihabitans marinus]
MVNNKTGMTKKVREFIASARKRLRDELKSASPERREELLQAEHAIQRIVDRSKKERIAFGTLTEELNALEKRDNKRRANKSGRSHLNWQNEHLPMNQAGAPSLGKRR